MARACRARAARGPSQRLSLRSCLQAPGSPVQAVVQLRRDVRQQRRVALAEQGEHPVRGEVDVAGQVLVPLGAVAGRALRGQQRGPAPPFVGGEGLGQTGVRAQGVGQAHGVLQGESGAGADGVVGGVGGVAEQDQVAVVPGAVGEGAEGLPGGAGAGDQGVAVEDVGEELLQQGEALALAGPVQAEAGAGLRGALDDTGAVVAAVGVAVGPDPAVLGLGEGEGEGVEDLRGAEPDVRVAAGGDTGAEAVGRAAAQGAVHAVGRDDEVRARGRLRRLALELQADAEGAGPPRRAGRGAGAGRSRSPRRRGDGVVRPRTRATPSVHRTECASIARAVSGS